MPEKNTSLFVCSSLFVALIFNLLHLPALGEAEPKAQSAEGARSVELKAIVANWLKIPALAHSNVGLELMDVPTGKVLFSYNGNRRFVPASVVKAITCACAYDELGPEFTYKTVLAGEGKLTGDRLHGNLVIVPSQDPTISRADLAVMIKEAVKSQGAIKQIDGKIKFTGILGADGFNPAWLVEDWGRYWMPVTSDLVVDRNITHTEGLPAIYKARNANSMHGALFDSLLSAKYGPSWTYADSGRRNLFVYRSNHPQSPNSVTLAVANPNTFNTVLVEQLLKQNGVKLLNQNIAVGPGDQIYQLAVHSSKPLSTILQTTLHKSDNLYAQQVLRTLGVRTFQTKSEAEKKTAADQGVELDNQGLIAISKWLSQIGVPAQEVLLFDGCGLARKNGISPHALNLVLRHMAGDDATGKYLDLLKANDESDKGRGSYRFKTGTMDTVRAISGILATSGKQNLALTIMVNGHTPSVRNLKIAMSVLINKLRVIKQMGPPDKSIQTATESDPSLDVAEPTRLIIDQQALNAAPKAPVKKSLRKKGRKSRGH